jgi:hypothetical protein
MILKFDDLSFISDKFVEIEDRYNMVDATNMEIMSNTGISFQIMFPKIEMDKSIGYETDVDNDTLLILIKFNLDVLDDKSHSWSTMGKDLKNFVDGIRPFGYSGEVNDNWSSRRPAYFTVSIKKID